MWRRAVGFGSAALAGLLLAILTRTHDGAHHPAVAAPQAPARHAAAPASGGGLHVTGTVLAAVVLVAVIVAWVLVVRRLRRR